MHKAPEAYGQVAYDGFGNPVGFLLPRLFRLLRGRPQPQPAMMPLPEPVPPAPDMGEVAYDGLGNQVGLLIPPFLRPGLPVLTPSRV